MADKPTYIGADNIINGYDYFIEQGQYWSIWKGRRLFAQSFTEDPIAAKQRFNQIITDLEQGNNSDIFEIRFHPVLTGGYVTDKTPVTGTMVVRVSDNDASQGVGDPRINAYYQNVSRSTIDQFKELLKPLTDEIAELKANQNNEQTGGIAGLLNHPLAAQIAGQLMPHIAPIIGGLLGNVLGQPASHGHVPNLAINGIPEVATNEPAKETPGIKELEFTDEENELVFASLDHLAAMGLDPVTDLPKMVAYAKNNKAMFDMLLLTIRS